MKSMLLVDQPYVAPTLRDHGARNATRVARPYCEAMACKTRNRLRCQPGPGICVDDGRIAARLPR